MKCNTPRVYQSLEDKLLSGKMAAFEMAKKAGELLGADAEQVQFWEGVACGFHSALAWVGAAAEQTCNGCDSEG